MLIFTTGGATYSKVMHTIESSLSRYFFDTLQSSIRHMVTKILSARKILEVEVTVAVAVAVTGVQ